MKKVFLVLAGLLISCFNLYSQIHIKEKVEIEPLSIEPLSSTSLASTGTFQMTLTGGPSTIQVGGKTYSDQGGLSITVPNVSGYYAYHVTPGKIVDGVKVQGTYSIKAIFCGDTIMDHSGTAYDVFGSGYALCDDPKLTFFRDFEFKGPNGVFVYDFRKAIPEVLAEQVPMQINELFSEKTSFKNAFSKFTLLSDDLVLAEYTYRLILKWFDFSLRMHPKRSEQKVQHNTAIRNRINDYIDAIQNRIDRINKGIY